MTLENSNSNDNTDNIIINYRRKTNFNNQNAKNPVGTSNINSTAAGEKESFNSNQMQIPSQSQSNTGNNVNININTYNNDLLENNLLNINETKLFHSNSEKINEMEFDNCNVYLKNNINPESNRPYSRKRTAFKYIEDNLEKEKTIKNLNNFNSSNNLLKNLTINDNKITNSNSNTHNPSISSTNASKKIITNRDKEIENKPKIIKEENKLNEKKPEYESRRKKQMNFINGFDYSPANQAHQQKLINNNFNKEAESSNINSNTNIISSINYESRRVQGGFSKNILTKNKEAADSVNNKNKSSKNALKI